MALATHKKAFPHWVRWAAMLWLVFWLVVYWRTWGAANFLHLCDIAVILACIGFASDSVLLISSQAVASLLVDLAWTIDAGWRLLFGHHLIGGTEYLWDAHYPLWVRLLSLFHIVLPALLLWALHRIGYDRRGWLLQLPIALAAIIASRFTSPAENINYVFADPFFHLAWGPAPVHVAAVFSFMLLVVYLPTHLFLSHLFAPASSRETAPR